MQKPSGVNAAADRAAPPIHLIGRVRTHLAMKVAMMAILMPLFTAGYVATQYLSPFDPVTVPQVFADRAVPFHAWWVWPYVSLYVFIPLGPALAIRVEELRDYTIALSITAAVCFVVFVALPTSAPRDYLESDEPLNWAMRLIVWVDRPVNACPSLHASLVTLTLLAGWRALRDAPGRTRLTVMSIGIVWATAILLGTLGTKQHRFIDLAAGAGVALAAHGITIAWMRRRTTVAARIESN